MAAAGTPATVSERDGSQLYSTSPPDSASTRSQAASRTARPSAKRGARRDFHLNSIVPPWEREYGCGGAGLHRGEYRAIEVLRRTHGTRVPRLRFRTQGYSLSFPAQGHSTRLEATCGLAG